MATLSLPAYEVWLTTDAGVRIAQLTTLLGLDANRAVNKIGWFSLNLPLSFDINLISPDRMVQVWRQPRGGAMGLWRVYFVRKWTFATQGAQETIQIEGPDVNDLLRRRIVAAYASSTQALKTDLADDMMKEVVTQALLDSAAPTPTAGTRVWSNLSVAADLGLGPSLTRSFPFDYLLTSSGQGALAAISKASKEAGTEVFFDILPDVVSGNSITLRFHTFTGQPGQDVSDRVVFEQTNLENPTLTYDYSEEENYIYAGGQGERTSRNIQQVYDTTRYGASIWGRCEGFADARNQTSDNGVRESGRAKLEEGRPKISFSAGLLDTAGTRFGIDWDFGYMVKTRYKNIEFDSIVSAVSLHVDANGEKVTAKAEYQS